MRRPKFKFSSLHEQGIFVSCQEPTPTKKVPLIPSTLIHRGFRKKIWVDVQACHCPSAHPRATVSCIIVYTRDTSKFEIQKNVPHNGPSSSPSTQSFTPSQNLLITRHAASPPANPPTVAEVDVPQARIGCWHVNSVVVAVDGGDVQRDTLVSGEGKRQGRKNETDEKPSDRRWGMGMEKKRTDTARLSILSVCVCGRLQFRKTI